MIIPTDKVNEWEYEKLIHEYREFNHGIQVCLVNDIMDWINSMELSGLLMFAESEELQAQKRGELIILNKLRKSLRGDLNAKIK